MPRQLYGKKGTKKQIKGKNKKKYNFKKIRKFRIAVIAVYFALLFPKFSNMFTLKRFQKHKKLHSQPQGS